VALDLRDSRYIAVNRSGQLLWGSLAEGATRDELIQSLVGAFEIDTERAAADVDAFTAELDSRDLLMREQSDG